MLPTLAAMCPRRSSHCFTDTRRDIGTYFLAVTVISWPSPTSLETTTVVRIGRGSLKVGRINGVEALKQSGVGQVRLDADHVRRGHSSLLQHNTGVVERLVTVSQSAHAALRAR
jgi:hypothetical protein